MRTTLYAVYLSLMAGLFYACSAPDSLGSINLVEWRNDRGGCSNDRLRQLEAFNGAKNELLGKSVNEIGRLFGRPDIAQLGKRNQKIYMYYLEAGEHCEMEGNPSDARKVVFFFNAVGILNQISVQKEMPE